MKIRYALPLLAATAVASVAPATAQQAVDYSDGANWLCRPDRDDACAVDLASTVVLPDGTVFTEEFQADPNAPIDCFYVYPTVSTDRSTHSDMTPDPAELRVIEQQFARFRSACRAYAPSYRQVTLMGLQADMADGSFTLDQGTGYDDVLNAFRHYLEHDNAGRGFVLIGHSQGAFVLTRLVAEEIDGQPVQDRLVSAILLGAAPTVAEGRDVGGSFDEIPLCRSASQIGCVIAYSAYRSTAPPPEDSWFGIAPAAGLKVACANPAALAGGAGALHAYLSGPGVTIAVMSRPTEWVAGGPQVETPFVSVPGLLTSQCTTNEHATYLEITVRGDPSDPRTDDIGGDLTAQWGLHLVDANLAMGNLLGIVRQQAAAYERSH